MAIYRNAVLTNGGRRLLQDIIAGNGELEFLYAKTGCGTCEEDMIKGLSDLVSPVQKFYFSSVNKEGNDSVILKVSITNEGLKNPYHLTEIGVYARKKGGIEEVLYCLIVAEKADVLPADEKKHQVIFRILVKLHDAEKTTIMIEHSAFALAEDLRTEIIRAQESEGKLQERLGVEIDRAVAAENQIMADVKSLGNTLKGVQKITNAEIDLILEGLAAEEDESELSSGGGDIPEDYEIVSEAEILEVLNS